MTDFKFKTKGNANPQGKPRVYFTCHPDDFERAFEKICEDMNAEITENDRATDLEQDWLSFYLFLAHKRYFATSPL